MRRLALLLLLLAAAPLAARADDMRKAIAEAQRAWSRSPMAGISHGVNLFG